MESEVPIQPAEGGVKNATHVLGANAGLVARGLRCQLAQGSGGQLLGGEDADPRLTDLLVELIESVRQGEEVLEGCRKSPDLRVQGREVRLSLRLNGLHSDQDFGQGPAEHRLSFPESR